MTLPIPREAINQHAIMLGKTGSGKSSAMRVLVEKLLDEAQPVAIIDPKGDWWGLKSSASGKEDGYPVVIFGGEHADVPLNARAGATVAELAATGNRPCIIDLGGWMPGERTQFWIDFASTFFKASRGRRWLVIDEVHNLAPKGKLMDPAAAKMLHWSNRLASEGRGKGITLVAASQRPQKVHNDFLTSCETLIAMRVIHAADRQALKDWIDGCGDPDKGKLMIDSVAQMKCGEAWAWSPEIGFGPEHVKFPMFKTYDSFKPQTGEAPAKLKGWADVDLAEITKKLELVIKEADANDPEKLKARIRELQNQLKSAPGKTRDVAVADPKAIERAVRQVEQGFRQHIGNLETRLKTLHRILTGIATTAANAADMKLEPMKPFALPKVSGGEIHERGKTREPAQAAPTHAQRPYRRPEAPSNAPNGISGTPKRILQALAEFEAIGKAGPIPRSMAASWCGVKATTGSFKNYVSQLRVAGMIEDGQDGDLILTDAGRATVPAPDRPATTEALLERAASIFGKTPAAILRLVHGAYPGEVAREHIAETLGIQADTGSFKNYLSELRSAGLITDARERRVKAADWLFL